jgi:hypothetical protein
VCVCVYVHTHTHTHTHTLSLETQDSRLRTWVRMIKRYARGSTSLMIVIRCEEWLGVSSPATQNERSAEHKSVAAPPGSVWRLCGLSSGSPDKIQSYVRQWPVFNTPAIVWNAW